MTDHCCLLMHNEFKYSTKLHFKIQIHLQIWQPPVANFTRPLGMGGGSKKELFGMTKIQIQLPKTVSPIVLWIAVAFLEWTQFPWWWWWWWFRRSVKKCDSRSIWYATSRQKLQPSCNSKAEKLASCLRCLVLPNLSQSDKKQSSLEHSMAMRVFCLLEWSLWYQAAAADYG